MSEWRTVDLAEVADDISYGYTESASDEPIGPKFLRITDIVGGTVNWATVPYCPINEKDLAKYRLIPGDIVIARTGATTGANYTVRETDPKDVVFASYLIRYRIDRSRALPEYVGYCLRSSLWSSFVEGVSGGSAQPGANAKVLGGFEFDLPDLPEQRSIASVLSSLDAKIDLLHRQNKTLEAMAETLFRQWFVEEAEEGWEEKTVADIADVTSGKRPPERFAVATSDARVPVWGGNGPMAYTREALVDSEVLLTGRVGTLGSIFRINTPIWPSDNTLLLTARRPEAKEFLFQQLRSIDFAQLNRGSTQPLLTQSDLKAQSFPMPPDELLLRYHEISRDLYARVDANLKAIQTITALRDTLLPKLMSGEVRVEELTTTNA